MVELIDRFQKYKEGFQLVQDISSISLATTCGYKYKLKNIEGWRPKVPKASKTWGILVHQGLQSYYTQKFYGKSKDQAVRAGIDAILENSKDFQSDDTSRTVQTAIRAIIWRGEDRWNDGLKTLAMPDGSPALEVRFEVPFTDKVRLSGRIDRIVEFNELIYPTDFKTTTSSLTDYFFDLYAMDDQPHAYDWVLRKFFSMPVAGFIIDGTQSGVNFTRFGLRTFRRTDGQLDQWKKDIDFELKVLEEMHRTGHFPQRRTSCNNYGGCEFKQHVCTLPTEHHKTWLEAMFNQSLHKDLSAVLPSVEYPRMQNPSPPA